MGTAKRIAYGCQPLGGFITTLRVMHGPDVLLVAPKEGDLASHLAVKPFEKLIKTVRAHTNPRWDLTSNLCDFGHMLIRNRD